MSDFINQVRESLENLGARPKKQALAIYYLDGRNLYVRATQEKTFVIENTQALRRHLRMLGYCPDRLPDENVSEVDRIIHETHEARTIVGTMESGILSEGTHVLENGEVVLVTLGPEKIVPRQGEFPITGWLVDKLLGGEQVQYFWGWCQGGLFSLYLNRHRPGQALFLVGPSNAGKSLLQNLVITKLFGNRSANPFAWLSGQTRFNDDLFTAVHLCMEDEFVACATRRERAALGAMVKKIVSVELQPYSRKFANRFNLNPHWMPSASFNGESHCLACIPEFTPDILDKLLVTKCQPIDFEELERQFPGINGDREILNERITAEIPAIVWHLLNEYQVPIEIQHSRHHVKGYVNPEIAELCYSYSEEAEIYGILCQTYEGKSFVKTEYDIALALENSGCRTIVAQFRKNTPAINPFLETLSKRFPSQIQYAGVTNSQRQWKLDFSEKSS